MGAPPGYEPCSIVDMIYNDRYGWASGTDQLNSRKIGYKCVEEPQIVPIGEGRSFRD